ncbi:hypothetical protein ACLUS7_04010 [Enterobacterales bacterium BD_CKDN230030183-1A_HGKHYDSX7]
MGKFQDYVGERVAGFMEADGEEVHFDAANDYDQFLVGGGKLASAILTGIVTNRGSKSPKNPVKELEVDSFKNLKTREVVGDGLEHDHIPSFKSLLLAKEKELGRSLTDDETRALYNNATAIELPRDIHVAGRTYGGKNTLAQAAQDAADLCGAVCHDTATHRKNLLERGYSPDVVDAAIAKIIQRNRENGVID